METIRMGLHESINGISKHGKSADAVSIAVSVTESIGSDKTVSIYEESTNGVVHKDSATQFLDFTRVSDVFQSVKTIILSLDGYEESIFRNANLRAYLQHVATERLIDMPRRGTDWDRVLRTAHFFGQQIWAFGEQVGQFATSGKEAASTSLVGCRILLEVCRPVDAHGG